MNPQKIITSSQYSQPDLIEEASKLPSYKPPLHPKSKKKLVKAQVICEDENTMEIAGYEMNSSEGNGFIWSNLNNINNESASKNSEAEKNLEKKLLQNNLEVMQAEKKIILDDYEAYKKERPIVTVDMTNIDKIQQNIFQHQNDI